MSMLEELRSSLHEVNTDLTQYSDMLNAAVEAKYRGMVDKCYTLNEFAMHVTSYDEHTQTLSAEFVSNSEIFAADIELDEFCEKVLPKDANDNRIPKECEPTMTTHEAYLSAIRKYLLSK